MTTNYEKGRSWEYAVIHTLREWGYLVIRNAGSHFPDIVAIGSQQNRGRIFILECKVNDNVAAEEKRKLAELAQRHGAVGALVFKRKDKGKVYAEFKAVFIEQRPVNRIYTHKLSVRTAKLKMLRKLPRVRTSELTHDDKAPLLKVKEMIYEQIVETIKELRSGTLKPVHKIRLTNALAKAAKLYFDMSQALGEIGAKEEVDIEELLRQIQREKKEAQQK